ncbi:hypothetical protein ATANTOWER_031488, partial [Ataeniobius toweri]|nr:hypothetical protein [Ataeniobius toweri]
EGGDDDSDDPQVYESMFNIQSQANSSDTTQASELELPHLPAVVSQDKKEDSSLEDVYEYDRPRPVVPLAPTRRNFSEINCPAAAFSSLSMDASVEAGTHSQPAVASRVLTCK